MSVLSDDATTEDLLDRERVAESLAKLIISSPDGSSFRLGIYGGWGEGKTSVMRMMEAAIEVEGHRSVMIAPWTAETQREITELILASIVDELGLERGIHHRVWRWWKSKTGTSVTETVGGSVGDVWKDISDRDWKLKLMDRVVGTAVSSATSTLRGWRATRLVREIQSALEDQRLVVFIDDLDRLPPSLLPNLLLNLREALSLPNLFYVIGLSPEIVQEGLQEVHPGWNEPLRFLEKIVEYPIFLPETRLEDRRRYATALASKTGLGKDSALEQITALLPKNPRQLKLFVRYLSSLRDQLDRFDDDEISRPALYLSQLLLLEFPKKARMIASSPETVKWIESYVTRTMLKETDESPPPLLQPPEQSTEDAGQSEANQRVIEICTAIGEHFSLTSDYSVASLIRLLDEPPIITWKEFRNLATKAAGEKVVIDTLVEWANSSGARDRRLRTVFLKVVEHRRRIWSDVTEADSQGEIDENLSRLDSATRILRGLLDDVHLIEFSIVDIDDWWFLFDHLRDASRFQKPADTYRPVRENELKLLADSAKAFSLDQKNSLLVKLIREFPGDRDESADFKNLAQDILRDCEHAVSVQCLRRFEEPDGISILWGESSRGEKLVAFDPSSLFHSSEFRGRLAETLHRANKDLTVQKNALTYFRMLAHGGLSGSSSFPRKECRELLGDREFLRMLWSATTAKRLNLRVVGDLRRHRDALLSEFDLSDEDLPTNEWWTQLQNEFSDE